MTRLVRPIVLALFAVATLTTCAGAEPSPVPSASVARVTTESGLRYVDLAPGSGPTPKPGQNVSVRYTISAGGKRLAGSAESQPFIFAIDRDQALKGLNEGVSTMKAGGRRKLFVPPELGY